MITGVRIFSPTLLKAARGDRRRIEIVRASKGAFTKSNYSSWESGRYIPNDANLAALSQALGVRWEDISTPIEMMETSTAKL